MARYDHLPLFRILGELERRKRPGWGTAPLRDPVQHADALQALITNVVSSVEARPKIEGVSEPLVVQVRNLTPVDPAEWPRVDMQVLATDPRNTVVLLAGDGQLTKLREKITRYREPAPEGQKGQNFASLVAPMEEFAERTPQDKIGPVLRSEGYAAAENFHPDQEFVVDVELYRPSDDMIPVFSDRIEKLVQQAAGQVVSRYFGSPTCLMCRAKGSGGTVIALLEAPEVLSIDLPPQPDAPPAIALELDIGDVGAAVPAAEDSPTIGIIDSGLTSAHPLLAGSVAGAFGVPDALGDADEWGHGTPVSGVAVFGDISFQLQHLPINARFRLASARVLNAEGKFDDILLTPDQMEKAIRRLHDEYGCRVINLSIADPKRPAAAKPSAWAAVLDQLARELDLVIVVAAGNRPDLLAAYGEQVVEGYPSYLFDDNNRILEPATAANVLTVGSIAHSNGLLDEDGVEIRSIAQSDEPSPFSRIGPGVSRIQKPDLVDYGGTVVYDGAVPRLLFGDLRAEAGITTLNSAYLERLLTARCGTSYASPLVAYKAAALRERFPDASANLIRAVLGIVANQPTAAAWRLANYDEDDIARVLGYGLANLEHALSSDDNRVILFAEDRLPSDKFAVFEVPVPKLFQTTKGRREIRVALAFDPATRHTRADYLGHTMSFELFRGLSDETVFDVCRKWTKDDEGAPAKAGNKYKCMLTPSIERRRHSTLQVARFLAQKDMSHYGDRYHLAVKCEADWSLEPSQRFAVVVQMRHEAEIPLYSRVQERIKVRA